MGFSPGEKQKVLKRIAALESKVEGLLSAKAKPAPKPNAIKKG